jgi:hypothetical protein
VLAHAAVQPVGERGQWAILGRTSSPLQPGREPGFHQRSRRWPSESTPRWAIRPVWEPRSQLHQRPGVSELSMQLTPHGRYARLGIYGKSPTLGAAPKSHSRSKDYDDCSQIAAPPVAEALASVAFLKITTRVFSDEQFLSGPLSPRPRQPSPFQSLALPYAFLL